MPRQNYRILHVLVCSEEFPEHSAKLQTSRTRDNALFCNYKNPILWILWIVGRSAKMYVNVCKWFTEMIKWFFSLCWNRRHWIVSCLAESTGGSVQLIWIAGAPIRQMRAGQWRRRIRSVAGHESNHRISWLFSIQKSNGIKGSLASNQREGWAFIFR